MGFFGSIMKGLKAIGKAVNFVTKPITKAIGYITKPIVKALSPILDPILKPIGKILEPMLRPFKSLMPYIGIIAGVALCFTPLGFVGGSIVAGLIGNSYNIAKDSKDGHGTADLTQTVTESALTGVICKGASGVVSLGADAAKWGSTARTVTDIGANVGASLATAEPVSDATQNLVGSPVSPEETATSQAAALGANVGQNVANTIWSPQSYNPNFGSTYASKLSYSSPFSNSISPYKTTFATGN